MDVEAALEQLYAARLDEFTATRNALAKELGGAEGATIKALKKPNIVAWAINQLARAHADDVKELFEATEKVRQAQRRVLSGGKASDLRRTTDERNKVAARLTKLVEKILSDAGHSAGASTLAGVRDSFVAVASDDAGADLLRKGRLTRELQPGSIVDVGGLALVPRDEEEEEEPRRDRNRLQEARRERDEARAALKEARDALKKANSEATRLEIEADSAAKRAKTAQEKAEFARRAADARRAEVEEAEEAVKAAERAVREAGN